MLWPRRARVAVGDGAGEQAAEGVVGAAAAVVVAAEVVVVAAEVRGPSGPPASSCGWRRGGCRGSRAGAPRRVRVHVELDGVGGRDGEAAQGGAQPGPVGQVLDTVPLCP